jgi:chromosomal replication initiator protein
MYETITATCNVNYWVMPITLQKVITAQSIIDATCTAFEINKVALLSRKRSRNLVKARFICMHILSEKLKISLSKIGDLFHRHHTTVIYALAKIKNDLSVPAYRQETNELIKNVIKFL